MKLTIDRAIFLKALSHGQSVVERRTTIPILSHVLLKTIDSGLELSTTDMDISLQEKIPADIHVSGAITVSAHMLFDIVRKLPEASSIDLSLNSENGQLTLKAGRSKFNLSSLPVEQFPQLTQGELPHEFQLEAATLKRLIDRAKFAMSNEDTRYYLNGIYLHAHGSGNTKILRSVATDAHRLACIEAPTPSGAEEIPGIIVGRKTVTEVRKLLDETESNITIRLSTTRIEFVLSTATLSSRLIDGSYPDYEQAIPTDNNKQIILDAKSFAAAVDRVATVVTDKLRVIKMHVTNNMITLSAASHELGSALEEIPVDYPCDDPVEIGFNAKYLLDIAQQIGDDEAQIMLSDGTSPALIRGMNDSESTFVLMPMRV